GRGVRSLHFECKVVHHEGGLQRNILRPYQEDPDGLALEGGYIERLLGIAGVLVQIREGRQRGKHRVRTVAYLHAERIEGDGGRRLRRVDVQEEAQGRRRNGGRDRHLLEERIGMRDAIAVQPGLKRSAVGRLRRRVVDDACGGVPDRVGQAVLETGIEQE